MRALRRIMAIHVIPSRFDRVLGMVALVVYGTVVGFHWFAFVQTPATHRTGSALLPLIFEMLLVLTFSAAFVMTRSRKPRGKLDRVNWTRGHNE